ncbi:MAG: DUF192 domain-containing protein [Candidatus Omnitrophica bacterium]|nr:DUF192 domain-containing protein [Candidatus Omnitrophota bacterium]
MKKIINTRTGEVVIERAHEAQNFVQRLIGLMFRKGMNPQEALIFYKASAIHTCFMRFAIDIVFLDRDMQVVKVYHSCKPMRIASCPRAKVTLEMIGGASKETISMGDVLKLV